VFFSPGGHVIYQHYPGKYKDEELLVAAEYFVGETFSAHRWKVHTVTIERPGGKM
jgi:hypothetical protein